MARLPAPARAGDQYGARPSLRTNRLDQPAQPGIIADAVANAAQNFASIYGDIKEKEDRLNYSLAKQELLRADIEEREKFKDDDDYATYDERYREAMNTRRNDILGRYNLAPGDAQLWNAEADLITERSSVNVQAESQTERRVQTRATIDEDLIDMREQVINADPQTANDLMLNGIEMLRSAEADGIYNEQEVLEKIQGLVTDVSVGRLDSMDVEDRIAELELSLAHRDARGPITIEDLEAGKGSGSIADYLHRDVVQKMLDDAKDEDRISTIQGRAFDIIDQVLEAVPGTNAQDRAEQLQMARSMLDRNDPEYGALRNFMESELAQRQAEREGLVNQLDKEMEMGMVDMIEAGSSYGSLPASSLSRLPRERREALRRYAENVQRNEGFAEATDPEVLADWYQMSRQQKLNTDLRDIDWKNGMDNADWERALREQAAYRDAQAAGKDPNIYRGDPDDEVLRNMLVGTQNHLFQRVPTPGSEDYDRYVRIDMEANRRLIDASLKKYAETGSGYLYPQEVHDIIASVVSDEVFINRLFGDDPMIRASMTAEELADPNVRTMPYDEVILQIAPRDAAGNPQNPEQYFQNIIDSMGRDHTLSKRDVEHAWMLWTENPDDPKPLRDFLRSVD